MKVYRWNILALFVATLSLMGIQAGSIAEASGSWPNEPTGSTVIVDCPFSGSLCPGIWDAYNSASFATDTTAPLSPGNVLDSYMATNSVTGSGQWGVALPDAKELYIGTWWSTNADFQGYSNNQNKMLFARRPEIDNNFLVWQGFPGQPKTLKWYGQMTYDNCGYAGTFGMCYSRGDGTGWFEPNTGANATVAAGSGWHRIEIYLKTSTTKTSRDGIVRWWLDGAMVGNYSGVNLSPGGLQDFQINHAWDGSGSCATRDCTKSWHHYWDHLHISIGKGVASPDQPAGPPAAPRIAGITVP